MTSPPPRKTLHDIIALALYLAALVVYFWPLLLARAALFYFDVTELNYAYRHFYAQNLKAGHIYFWCKYLYNGFPLYSESQAGYWHPLKFVFYPFFSTWAAFGFEMVASLAVAGLGTYAWLRRHSLPAGALAGALLITFGGFTWAHFVHTSMINALASVPWILWGLERSWRTGRLWGALLSAFALACQVFAGHLQDAVFSVQLIALLTFYQIIVNKTLSDRRRFAAIGTFAIIAGILIAAVQWMPSYELLKRTPRTEGLGWKDQTFGSWHPQLLPSLFVREAFGTRARDTDWMDGFYPYHEMNAYLGGTAMLLALIGARNWRNPWVGMWLFIGFVSTVFMLGRFTLVMDFWHRIPVLGSSRIPVRYHLWATLATAALASQGLSHVIGHNSRLKIHRPLWLLAGFSALATGIFIWGMIPWWTEAGRWTTNYHRDRNNWLTRELLVSGVRCIAVFSASLILLQASGRTQCLGLRTSIAYLLAAIVGFDLMASHWWDMPTVDPSFWTSPPAAASIVKNDPKASRVMGIPRYSAGEPGYASKPTDFFAPRDAIGWSLPLAYGLESNIGETPFRPARLIRLTNLAGGEPWRFSIEGVSHIISGQPMQTSLKPITAGSAYVYRLPDPEPRWHWAKSAKIISGPGSTESLAEAEMQKNGPANTSEVIIIEELTENSPAPAFGPYPAADTTAGITLESDEGDTMRISLNAAADAWLRIGVSFDPGWHATIDGQPASIYPAQLAYMAVPVPAGKHTLELRYVPAGFQLGLGVTLAGVAVGVLLCLFYRDQAGESGPDSTRCLLTPAQYGILLFLLLAISAIGIDANGRPSLSSRWTDSWHRFTWGAGIEAIGK
ncbi:MAG: YfhO family protein [bacterium]